jgi:type I restriction enzyme S subunit
MKKGWQTKKLGETCEVVNGGTPKTGVLEYWDGQHRWITPAEMGKRFSPYVSETDRMISDLGLRNSSAQMLPPHSVILSSRAPIGHLVINTEPMATNQGCKGLIPRSQLQHKFLYYYLSSIVDLLNSLGTGATFKELSGGKLKEVEIPVPPLPEQQRIVRLLDEAFEGLATAKANAEKNLQNARALFESHLQAVFTQRGEGWVEKRLGEIAEFKNGLNYNKSSGGQTLPVVGVADFQDNYFVPISELQSATIDGELADNYAIQTNDILTVRSNGSKHLVGRCMLVGDVGKVVSYSGFIIRIRFDSKIILPKFLLHFMKCQVTRDILTAGGGGANITNINQEKLSDLLVILPPYKTQIKLAGALDDIYEETQRLAHIYERKLAALAELKQSLLHQAFTGEL